MNQQTEVETFTCPIFSTMHIPEHTAKALDSDLSNAMAACYRTGDYGWLIYTNPGYEGDLVNIAAGHPELQALLKWGREHGHRYIMLDCDGDTYPELFPVFEW